MQPGVRLKQQRASQTRYCSDAINMLMRQAIDRMGQSRLYTFDVFDTLLTRVWLQPSDVFLHAGLLLAKTGLSPVSSEDWCSRRRAVEAELRKRRPAGEIHLAEIYAELRQSFRWSAEEADNAMRVELDCERTASRPIPFMLEIAGELLFHGQNVAFISDFYITGDFVRELLGQAAFVAPPHSVFVSCDEGFTKRSGELFYVVTRRCDVPPALAVHIGDNLYSDVTMARSAGLGAIYFSRGAAAPNEKRLATAAIVPGRQLLGSLVAGAARRARLDRDLLGRDNAIWDIATGIAAPLLFGYVLWVMHEARSRGIERLYFLARDGQILLRIAQQINRAQNLGFDLRYLHASRRAWLLPSAARGTHSDRVTALIPDGDVAIDDLLDRLGLPVEQVDKVFVKSAVLRDLDWTQSIATSRALRHLKSILTEPPFDDLILKRSEEELCTALEYFRRMDLFDGHPIAIVDIGWRGRLQQAIGQMIGAQGSTSRPVGFYLGLRDQPTAREAGEFITYLTQTDATAINPTLAELFCAADHGTVTGYARVEECVIPVLASAENRAALDWGLKLFQDGVLSYASHMSDALSVLEQPIDDWITTLRRAGLGAVSRLVRQPSKAEATLLGSFPHASNPFHSDLSELAPAISKLVFLQALITPNALAKRTRWHQASIARSFAFPAIARQLWTARLQAMSKIRERLGLVRVL